MHSLLFQPSEFSSTPIPVVQLKDTPAKRALRQKTTRRNTPTNTSLSLSFLHPISEDKEHIAKQQKQYNFASPL
jgi:hypothetical protein